MLFGKKEKTKKIPGDLLALFVPPQSAAVQKNTAGPGRTETPELSGMTENVFRSHPLTGKRETASGELVRLAAIAADQLAVMKKNYEVVRDQEYFYD